MVKQKTLLYLFIKQFIMNKNKNLLVIKLLKICFLIFIYYYKNFGDQFIKWCIIIFLYYLFKKIVFLLFFKILIYIHFDSEG